MKHPACCTAAQKSFLNLQDFWIIFYDFCRKDWGFCNVKNWHHRHRQTDGDCLRAVKTFHNGTSSFGSASLSLLLLLLLPLSLSPSPPPSHILKQLLSAVLPMATSFGVRLPCSDTPWRREDHRLIDRLCQWTWKLLTPGTNTKTNLE